MIQQTSILIGLPPGAIQDTRRQRCETDSDIAEPPSLALKDLRTDDKLARERAHDALRPIQMSKPDVLDAYLRGRQALSFQ